MISPRKLFIKASIDGYIGVHDHINFIYNSYIFKGERERKGEIYLSSFIYSVLVTYVGNDFAITRVISIVT